MANDWTSKEKIALLSNILEFGDQHESWSAISNDLSRTFQTRKEGYFSIKNCKQEYKHLVERYKPEWIQHGSSNGLKLPLAKYIWTQLKSIYRAELTFKLKENRKKLTEFYFQFETTINIKPNTFQSTPTASTIEITTPIIIKNENEQQEDSLSNIENISQPISDIQHNQSIHSTLSSENNPILSTLDNPFKEQPIVSDQSQIKEETHIEISNEKLICPNVSVIGQEQISIDSPALNPILSDHQTISPSPIIPDSTSSSRSNSETKSDIIKIIPTTTQKYHVYFSPKNSINKTKRKITDDNKIENENEVSSSSTTEQSKIPSSTAPMTRRSINTRSVPNTAAEQEEEKSRRFFAMLSENPNSWQSQSMAIIQYLLAHKQGYLFEHEITDEIAPKYHLYIRHPIALDTIRKNLESNSYQTKEYFKRDIYLMLYNAMKYNPRYHHVHRSAKHLFNITIKLFNLSTQDIYGQIQIKTNTTLPTTPISNDNPLIKRQRIK